MDYSQPGSSVCGTFQSKILEWVAISFSWGSSRTRDRTHVSCIGRQILYHWAIQEPQSKLGPPMKYSGYPELFLHSSVFKCIFLYLEFPLQIIFLCQAMSTKDYYHWYTKQPWKELLLQSKNIWFQIRVINDLCDFSTNNQCLRDQWFSSHWKENMRMHSCTGWSHVFNTVLDLWLPACLTSA